MSRKTKIITIITTTVVIALTVFIFFRYCFVYSSGVNAGDINYFQREGVIFKTYEGKMIQTGLKNSKVQGSIQSNEFKFSVVKESVARQLDEGSNTGVKLHWRRYLGTLPWRGNSQFIVDSVYVAKPVPTAQPVKQ